MHTGDNSIAQDLFKYLPLNQRSAIQRSYSTKVDGEKILPTNQMK